ncbi:MAG: low affinity iron permease family protein [Candidatus Eremiobacteraeota bacterium]|nr:low affinity iron permease family protein [Candidatus Eremiobacteraeota bacterium]MBV9403435.1 low affinity iron permease family protein [Candidatus Eremiobacteraeota bacterium]MBV9973542.1 low affinity iron permease family protein [Candidatus Eremiobacteraeota bacterium]
MGRLFSRFARAISGFAASPAATLGAALIVLIWAITGQKYHYSDTWQLVMTTTSSVVTFLMVFVIANAQRVDSAALMLKLDALIASQPGASNELIGIERTETLVHDESGLRDEIVKRAIE